MVDNIATQILNENNYTTSDISAINLEYLIDNAIDYVNMEAGTSIANLSGSAGSKSLAGTESEIFVVKKLSVLMIRAYKDRGPNVGVQGLTVNTLIADPQYSLFMKLIDSGITRLRGMSFKRT